MCHSWVLLLVRTCQATVAPDLENGWTDRAQTWYIDGDRLVWWRANVNWDLHCTCARAGRRFQMSRTAGPIPLKFGTLLGPVTRVPWKSVGSTPTQFCAYRAQPLARSFVAPKRRFTGFMSYLQLRYRLRRRCQKLAWLKQPSPAEGGATFRCFFRDNF